MESGLPGVDEGRWHEDGFVPATTRPPIPAAADTSHAGWLTQSSLPTWRLVLWLALPALAQQSLLLVVTLSDRYLAGHVEASLGSGVVSASQPELQAAHTTASYLGWFITSYTVLVSVGSTALVARFIGAGDRPTAVRVTHQSLLLAVVVGGLASMLGLAGGLEWMVTALQLEGEVATLAADYLWPMFALLVFQVIESAGIACLVGAGDTRTGLWVTMGVALVNLPLAWGFSFGFGSLPQLGFVGISLGTSLAHVLGGLAVLVILARGRFGLKLHLRLFRPHWELLRRLLRISVPAALDSLSVVVGQFWFLAIVNQLGTDAGAAHGIALGWEALGFLSGTAFGTAAMALVGQNLGAGRPDRAAHSGWVAFWLGCGLMCAMGALFFALAEPMFTFFCPDPSQERVIVLGVPVLRLVAFAMPALAATIVFTQALRGAGDTRVPVLFTWTGFFLVRIPLAYYLTLPHVELGPLSVEGWNLGLFGAWLAMFADITVRGLFFLYRFLSGSWKRIRV